MCQCMQQPPGGLVFVPLNYSVEEHYSQQNNYARIAPPLPLLTNEAIASGQFRVMTYEELVSHENTASVMMRNLFIQQIINTQQQ